MNSANLRRLLVAAAAVATLAISAACGDDDYDDDDNDIGGAVGSGGQVGVPSAGDAPGEQSGPDGAKSSILDRKIIFSASVALSVENVTSAFDEVIRIATTAGGFVQRSDFSDDDEGQRTATVTLRVPADRYQDTLADLRNLRSATLRTETARSTEVTEEFTDLQSRLRNLERTEVQYLTLLEQAASIPDILTVQDRIDSVRLQIEQTQGRLQALADLTDLATIDVSLLPVPPASVDGGNGPKPVGEAFTDAWAWFTEASRYVLSGVAVLAVAAIFLSLPAGLVFGAALLVRRA